MKTPRIFNVIKKCNDLQFNMMIISDHLLVMKQATILIVVVLSMHVCLRNGYISRGNRSIDAMLLLQLNCRHESARIAASHARASSIAMSFILVAINGSGSPF